MLNTITKMANLGIIENLYEGRGKQAILCDQTPFGSLKDLQADLGLNEYSVDSCYIADANAYHYFLWSSASRKYEITQAKLSDLMEKPWFLNFTENTRKTSEPNDNLKKFVNTANNVVFLGPGGHDYGRHGGMPTGLNRLGESNIVLSVEHDGVRFLATLPFKVAESLFGLKIEPDMTLKLANGNTATFEHWEKLVRGLHAYRNGSYYGKTIDKFDFTYDTLYEIDLKAKFSEAAISDFLKALSHKEEYAKGEIPLDGIKKTYERLAPIADQMLAKDPLVYCSYRTLASSCKQSIDGVKVSSVFNELFKDVEDEKKFAKVLKDFFKSSKPLWKSYGSKIEAGVKSLDSYKEKRKAVLKSQANRAHTKLMQETESLTLDKKKYKLTWKEIEEGNLPIGTFFRKSEQYFLLNDNWELWEEMFKRGFREEAIALANEVKGRTTYEKDLMSYFYFILYALPEYLKKQTGCKWKCVPKLVQSADELEPPKADDNGVARKRSALTPQVDNETKTVTVPYASLSVYGSYGTTYCYSHDYHVLSRGFSYKGYAVSRDVEEKLNGRDDYGLMFYTLTGSEQGRGYPTFLIIFERRERFTDTRVHFHRTHPSRSKSGDYNPIHHWVSVCYNWMAGNIKKESIKAQQGDLFFVQVKTDAKDETIPGAHVKGLDFKYEVNQYDKHCFERPVPFAEYDKAAKSNILGYIKLDKPTTLTHTEHDNVVIPSGTYAIHQCRSWEANPKGVWSLRID